MLNWLLAMHDAISLGIHNEEEDNNPRWPDEEEYSAGFVYNPHTDLLLALRPILGTSPSLTALPTTGRQQRKTHHNPETQQYYYSYDNSDGRKRHDFSTKTSYYGMQLAGSKLSVVLKTCFLYFITTTLVSFTLRETQERMLDFTQQLQVHVRNRQPVAHLVTRHFVDNLVFVPIMVGIIFFMIEFYRGDKVLAFFVLSIVWMFEVFSVVSVRSFPGIHFFSKIFFLLFALLHFYIFSFPFGFSYMALTSTVCFMLHSMLFFWHRFELPAVVLGQVTAQNPRIFYQSMGANSNGFQEYNQQQQSIQPSASPQQDVRDRSGMSSSQPHGAQNSRHDASAQVVPMTDEDSELQATTHQLHRSPQARLSQTLSTQHHAQRASRHMLGPISGKASGQGVHFMSPSNSCNALFKDGDEDDSSYMYFMGGEVVMREHNLTPLQRSALGSAAQDISSALSSHPALQPQPQQVLNRFISDPFLVSSSSSAPSLAGSEQSRQTKGRGIPDHVLAEVSLDRSCENIVSLEGDHTQKVTMKATRRTLELRTSDPKAKFVEDQELDPSQIPHCVSKQQFQTTQRKHFEKMNSSSSSKSTMDKKDSDRRVVLESNGGLPPVIMDDDDTTDRNDDGDIHTINKEQTNCNQQCDTGPQESRMVHSKE